MQLTNTDFEDYQQLLKLEDCDTNELRNLQKQYEIDKGKPDDIFINKLLVKVTNHDFDQLNQYGRVTPVMMAFLLNALKRIQGDRVPITLGMVNILSPPDSDYLEYDSFRENAYLQFTKYDSDVHEFLGLLIYLSKFQRWICTVQQPDYFEGMVVDFADDKRSSPEKLGTDIMQLCQESFNIEMNPESYKILNFNQRSRFKKTDFGAYIFTYLYKFLHSKDVLKTRFLDDELMELGQNRVIWMLLRVRMFEMYPEKIEEEFDKLTAKKKKMLDQDDEEIDKMRELEFEKYTSEQNIPQLEKYTDKEYKKLNKKFNKKGYNQTNVIMEKLDVQVLGYDFESLQKANFITPKLMQFLTVYLDVNDKVKLDKGIFFAQVNVLSTPDDEYFEYDLLRIDKDSGGKINLQNDSYVIILIYYKYKWAFALYDFIDKSATLVDFKMDDNQSFDDTVTDLSDIFKVEFNINVDDFSVRPEWSRIKEPGDAGGYVLHYLYRWLTARRLNDVKFDDRDKKLFRQKIEWLVLKFWELYESEEEERVKNEAKALKEKQKKLEEEEQEKLRQQALEEEEELRKKVRENRAQELRQLRDGGEYPKYNFSMETKHQGTQTHAFDGNRNLEGSRVNTIFSMSSKPPELFSNQQTLYTKQNPSIIETKGILDRFKQIDPKTLKKVPLGIDDLEEAEKMEVLKQLQFKKPEELEMEDKLYDILEIMQDPDKLKNIKQKNTNIGPYIDLLKGVLAGKNSKKKAFQPYDKIDFADLWIDQQFGEDPKDVRKVIKESMQDNKKKKDRLVDKHKNPTINTSWYYLEMTKRNIDPQYTDIIDDVIKQKKIEDTDNKYKAFMFAPSENKNYLENFQKYQTPEEFYRNRDMLEKIKEDFNKDLKRSDFKEGQSNAGIYKSHSELKKLNHFADDKQISDAQKLNSHLSNSYLNPSLSNQYNVSNLQKIGKTISLNRQDPTDNLLKLSRRKEQQQALEYQKDLFNNLTLKQMQNLKDQQDTNQGQLSKKRMVSFKKGRQKKNDTNEAIMPYTQVKPQLENPVVLRYNISLLQPEVLQIATHDILTENAFNFILFYIEEKHSKTTTQKMRLLNYSRIWFVPTQFYHEVEIMDLHQQAYEKATKYIDIKGNLIEKYDYMFIPIWRGEQKEVSLIVIDFINKTFVYYYIKRNEDIFRQNAVDNQHLQNINKFLVKYYMKKYQVNIDNYSWKYIIGSNSRINEVKSTGFYVLIFATFLTRGNFVFQGVNDVVVQTFKENIIKILQSIGINNDGEIQDFTKIPL